MSAVNYHKLLLQRIEKNKREGVIPKLLMHACCAPCLTYTLDFLSPFFDVAVYFYNPNIYGKEEYEKRLHTLESFLTQFNTAQNKKIKLIAPPYEPNKFYSFVKGFEKEKEGGGRCALCFEQRLSSTALYAAKNNYELFGTTLTISPHKNSALINSIGENVAKKEGVEFLFSDFKKEGGYAKSIELCKQYGLYRQDYCGCYFSYKDKYFLGQGD